MILGIFTALFLTETSIGPSVDEETPVKVVGQIMHISGLQDLVFNPNRKTIISVSSEFTIIWDISSGKSIRILPSTGLGWTSAAISQDGNFLALGDLNHLIYIWDLNRDVPPNIIAHHQFPVRDLAFDGEGRLLSAAAWHVDNGEVIGEVIISSIVGGHLIGRLPSKTGALHPVAFVPDGSRFITGSIYHTGIVWDGRSLEPMFTLPDNHLLRKIAVSPDSTKLAASIELNEPMKKNYLSLQRENGGDTRENSEEAKPPEVQALWMLSLLDGSLIHTFQDFPLKVTDMCWNQEGTRLATSVADNREVNLKVLEYEYLTEDQVNAALDIIEGENIGATLLGMALNNKKAKEKQTDHGETPARNAELTPSDQKRNEGRSKKTNGRWKKVAKDIGKVVLNRGKKKIKIRDPLGLSAINLNQLWSEGHWPMPHEKFSNFKLGDHFKRLGSIRIWSSDGSESEMLFYGKPVYALSFSPDGRYLAADETKGTIKLWDMKQKIMLRTLQGATRRVNEAVFSPDGRFIASNYGGKEFHLWEVGGRNKLRILRGHKKAITGLAFSPDGSMLVSTSKDKTLKLWDPATGTHLKTLTGHKKAILTATFSPDGRTLVSCSRGTYLRLRGNGEVFVWDLKTQEPKPINLIQRKGVPWRKLESYSSAYMPTPNKLLTLEKPALGFLTNERDLVFWDLQKHEEIWRKRMLGLYKFAMNGERNLLVTQHVISKILFGSNTRVNLWRLSHSLGTEVVREWVQEPLETGVLDMELHPTEAILATVNPAGYLSLWDTQTAQRTKKWRVNGHGLVFTPNGDRVLILRNDGQMEFWDWQQQKFLYSLVGIANTDDYIIYTDNHWYTSSARGYEAVSIVHGVKGYSFEQFDLTLNRPDLVLQHTSNSNPKLEKAYFEAHKKRRKRMGYSENEEAVKQKIPDLKIENKSELALSTGDEKVELVIQAFDQSGLERVHVWANDVPLTSRQGDKLEGQPKRLRKNVKVTLVRGPNKIQIAVRNSAGVLSARETVFINRKAELRRPELYVMSLGVNQYKQGQNLAYAVKDARDMVDYFTLSEDYGKVHSMLLLDEEVVREGIIAGRGFLENATEDDQILVFLSGHGLLDLATLDYYYATSDIDFDNPAERGLGLDDLENLLDGLRCRRKLVMIDTCFSGEVDRDSKLLFKKKIGGGQVTAKATYRLKSNNFSSAEIFKLLEESFVDLRRGSGSVVLSSASGSELSFEDEQWQNGVFTFTTLAGLVQGKADADSDGLVRVSELFDHISFYVRELTDGTQNPTIRRQNLFDDFVIGISGQIKKTARLKKKFQEFIDEKNPFNIIDLSSSMDLESVLSPQLGIFHRVLWPDLGELPKKPLSGQALIPHATGMFLLPSHFESLDPDGTQYVTKSESGILFPMFVSTGTNKSTAELKTELICSDFTAMADVKKGFAHQEGANILLDDRELSLGNKKVGYLITKSFYIREKSFQDFFCDLIDASKWIEEKNKKPPKVRIPLPKAIKKKKGSKKKDCEVKKSSGLNKSGTKKKKTKERMINQRCSRVFYHYIYNTGSQWVVFSFPATSHSTKLALDWYYFSIDHDPDYEAIVADLFSRIELQ